MGGTSPTLTTAPRAHFSSTLSIGASSAPPAGLLIALRPTRIAGGPAFALALALARTLAIASAFAFALALGGIAPTSALYPGRDKLSPGAVSLCFSLVLVHASLELRPFRPPLALAPTVGDPAP